MGESLIGNFYPVILAGGRGTRFWPLSRKRRAKQLLPLNSAKSMIQETVERLEPLASSRHFWIITNEDLRDPIVQQLPGLDPKQVLAEPVGRNTAPAIGLAAFLLERQDPDAVIGMFPSDHVIFAEEHVSRERPACGGDCGQRSEHRGHGDPAARAETGYGYIEAGSCRRKIRFDQSSASPKSRPRRYAQKFVSAGNYYWNSGMFVWGARTLADALREHLPNTAPVLEQIAASHGTS